MKILEISQNSPQWLDWRALGVGSSDAPVIMGVSPYKIRDDILHSKIEQLRRESMNAAQKRGKDLEPKARTLYEDLTGLKTRPVCVIHDKYPWLRASLDGLSEDNKIPLEIKAIKKEFHMMALRGQVPWLYWPQVQHDLLVTELDVLHYWSYSESKWFKTSETCVLVEVRPDRPYLDKLFKAEQEFWEEVQHAVRIGT